MNELIKVDYTTDRPTVSARDWIIIGLTQAFANKER